MKRKALADELSVLIERYRHSTSALEIYVKDSFRGIDRSQTTTRQILEKIRGGLAGEGTATAEPGPHTVRIELSANELKLLHKVVSDTSRYYESHPQMLLEMSLVYASALFDAFISDLLLAIFRHIPDSLRSKRTLTAEEALRFRNRDELIEHLAHREILDLMYKTVKEQFEYLHTSFSVDVFADELLQVSITDLAAIRERRNLVAHNNGLASAAYIAKFDRNASVGDRVVTDAASAESDRTVLRKVAIALASRLRHHLAPLD